MQKTTVEWETKSLKTTNKKNVKAVLQIVAGHRSLPTIWGSWSVKIDADFLKLPSIINV